MDNLKAVFGSSNSLDFKYLGYNARYDSTYIFFFERSGTRRCSMMLNSDNSWSRINALPGEWLGTTKDGAIWFRNYRYLSSSNSRLFELIRYDPLSQVSSVIHEAQSIRLVGMLD